MYIYIYIYIYIYNSYVSHIGIAFNQLAVIKEYRTPQVTRIVKRPFVYIYNSYVSQIGIAFDQLAVIKESTHAPGEREIFIC